MSIDPEALRRISQSFIPEWQALNPTVDASMIRRQVGEAADGLLHGKPITLRNVPFVELAQRVQAAKRAEREPAAVVQKYMAEQAKPETGAPAVPGADYAAKVAAQHGIDLAERRPVFTRMLADATTAMYAALDTNPELARKHGRIAHHAARMLGTTPTEAVLSVSRGVVAGDSDFG